MNMTPFRYRDIRENGYFRASEIPFNFEYLDYALKGAGKPMQNFLRGTKWGQAEATIRSWADTAWAGVFRDHIPAPGRARTGAPFPLRGQLELACPPAGPGDGGHSARRAPCPHPQASILTRCLKFEAPQKFHTR